MADRAGVEHRIDSYFDTIVTMARYAAVTGKRGSWSDVAVRAEKASRRWRTTQACHPALHAYFNEFALWSQILRECVLPDRQGVIAGTIHRIGGEEAGDGLEDIEALLGIVCPEDHATTSTRARRKPSLDELAVLKRLQDAERRGTVSALDSALRATVNLADRIGEDDRAGHPKCEPWPVFTVSWVLTKALWETMPKAHRTVLARLAQLLYFKRHAPEEREPEFFDQTPKLHVPRDADLRWSFDPAWRFVPNTQREEDPLDPGPEPWLIDDVEAPVRQGIEDEVTRKQELDRKLADLAAGGAARADPASVAHPAAP
jgi:hypothetical protein